MRGAPQFGVSEVVDGAGAGRVNEPRARPIVVNPTAASLNPVAIAFMRVTEYYPGENEERRRCI